LSVPKEYNICPHFEEKHSDLAKFNVSERQSTELTEVSHSEQNFFKKINADNEAAVMSNVSFLIAREIAAAGKYFTERKFVNKCLLIAASALCPDKKNCFSEYQFVTCDSATKSD
jgi:hypothetical protein